MDFLNIKVVGHKILDIFVVTNDESTFSFLSILRFMTDGRTDGRTKDENNELIFIFQCEPTTDDGRPTTDESTFSFLFILNIMTDGRTDGRTNDE